MSPGRPSSTTTVPSKPVEEIRNIYAARGFDGSKPIVTYCRIGERSKQLMVRVEAASWLRCPATMTARGPNMAMPGVTNKSGTDLARKVTNQRHHPDPGIDSHRWPVTRSVMP